MPSLRIFHVDLSRKNVGTLVVPFVLPHDRGKQLHGGGKAAVGPAQSTDTFGHARHRVFAHAGGGGGGRVVGQTSDIKTYDTVPEVWELRGLTTFSKSI